jgi:type IV secretory pathway VirJ component
MKKIVSLCILFSSLAGRLFAQHELFPVKQWTSAGEKPFVFFISGDGGVRHFFADLCQDIHQAGYTVAALDANGFFWNRKSPQQAAEMIASYLQEQLSQRPHAKLVLAGYSFGADAVPFIVNALPVDLKQKLSSVLLLSPSASTDLEIHIADMFVEGRKRSMDVAQAINHMGETKTVTIMGSEEHHFPVADIRLKNYTNEVIPGGHHFDGRPDLVATAMLKFLN